MMTPRLNKQHQWLPSCFDVNWQVFNLSNLMHDLNGGSSRMKTFPFQRLSTYSPPPHFFFTYCTFPHIFLIFFSDVFKRCPLVHSDWKILNQARCWKRWKVKMICTQLLSIPAIFFMNQNLSVLTMTPHFRRGDKENSVLMFLFCASIDTCYCVQAACFCCYHKCVFLLLLL